MIIKPFAQLVARCITVGLLCAMCMVSHLAAQQFGDDVAFLKSHLDNVIVLEAGEAKVAIVPAYQGRVMTSSAAGDAGQSFGWINRELIASGQKQPHIHAFGGEDRFWLGPEGGQYSIFFPPGAKFDLEQWQTPAPIDTDSYKVTNQDQSRVTFSHTMRLQNYSKFMFDLRVDRTVQLLEAVAMERHLGIAPATSVRAVGFESVNSITNTGSVSWKKETGLLSIWILGMFHPSRTTTIVAPIVRGDINLLGPRVNTNYFGDIPKARLKAEEDAVFFSGDGEFRSKFGISRTRCRPVMGSYDRDAGVLTIVQFTFDPAAKDYVNSSWEIQKSPYGGDISNSYNDGPPSPGAKPLGPFYELESSSQAAALAPNESLLHTHRTIHLTGPREQLDAISRKALGVSLEQIEGALIRPASLGTSGEPS